MNIAISACLIGEKVRYDGKVLSYPLLSKILENHNLIPICPETMAKLKTPRVRCERKGDKVIDEFGNDMTLTFKYGSKIAFQTILDNHCEMVILKEKSPSCGLYNIYNGDFNGTLINSNGLLYDLLKDQGIACFNENEIEKIKDFLFK